MKRTLRRESKALEIVGREALGARRFGPAGMSGADAARLSNDAAGAPSKAPPMSCRSLAAAPRPSRRDGQHRPHGRQGGREGPGSGASLLRCGPPCRPPPGGRGSRKTRASFGRAGNVCLRWSAVRVGAGNPAPVCTRTSSSTRLPWRRQGRRHGGPERPVLKHGPRSLTRARAGGPQEPRVRSESEGMPHGIRGGRRPLHEPAPSADPDFLERFEQERTRRDPKDRELWATRTRPEETLVEVRSGTDVQIVRQSCL